MSITFNDKNKTWNLSTPNTSYIIGLVNTSLCHLHYGKKITKDYNFECFFKYFEQAFSPVNDTYSQNDLPMEYPSFGSDDLRNPAIHVRYNDGTTTTRLEYENHKIYKGKPEIPNLPSAYIEDLSEADTLEINLCDKKYNLYITLIYTVYNTRDIITRSIKVSNKSTDKIELLKAMSLSLDIHGKDFDFIHLKGSWANERHIERMPVINGGMRIDSNRTSSSHYHNPFFALSGKSTTEDYGEVYGFGLVYSGNFCAGIETNTQKISRTYMGINDFNFRWILNPSDIFYTPEVILTYSQDGFNGMSQTLHNLIRERICRGKFRDTSRPILINNWEATYFDFNEEKILDIATTAKDLGVELMVLDDGWFGERDDITTSIGDWYAYEKKLPNGIDGIANKICNLGMKFGLWLEPEMVSPNSQLYKSHPDWIIQIEGRKASLGRCQFVLDLSRKDVCDYILDVLTKILGNAPISYIKWDMNRNISEPGSLLLPPENQQEFSHRYILGLYYILENITTKFPNVLFEGCSGGGGRFDLGMLSYFPQIWASDDSDAVERMYIQYGTSMFYPTSSMGAHISAVPNHQVNRITPLNTRSNIAMLGRFGYELDLATLTTEEKIAVKEQIKTYKFLEQIIHTGDMYRLKSPFETNNFAIEILSKDKKHIVVVYANILKKPNGVIDKLCLKGLELDSEYKNIITNETYGSDILMNSGLLMQNKKSDFNSELMIFERI